MPPVWKNGIFEILASEDSTPEHHQYAPYIKVSVYGDRVELLVDGAFGGDVGATVLTRDAARRLFTDALAALGPA